MKVTAQTTMLDVVARAEKRARQTGRPTCAICRHMRVRSRDEARCVERREEWGGEFTLDGDSHLITLTQRAKGCGLFDSMLEPWPPWGKSA